MNELIEKYSKHVNGLCGVSCAFFDIQRKCFENDIEFCNKCTNKCDFVNTHLYGCYEAARWGNKYIYYCQCGYIFVAIVMYNKDNIAINGIIAGPIVMGDREDYPGTDKLPNLSTTAVTDLTEILLKLFYDKDTEKVQSEANDTNNIHNEIYSIIDSLKVNYKYPIELEKDLQTAIISGDGKHSKELLNKLLGHIFFHSNSNFDTIKSRVLELIVLLSRSAIEGGANVEEIFYLNNSYIKGIEKFTSIEQLSIWLTNIINQFVGYVFDFREVKHSDIMFKVTSYIKDNYMQKMSLDDMAKHVFFSKSYLSKIFKDEMHCTLSEYINKIRIEKSKQLLTDNSISIADVANLVGFDDQSYFTRVFKSQTGISPGKYKENPNF